MLEDVSRTPNRLKMTHNKNICILLQTSRFGDTILRGGYGIRDQLQNPAHVLYDDVREKILTIQEIFSKSPSRLVVIATNESHSKPLQK